MTPGVDSNSSPTKLPFPARNFRAATGTRARAHPSCVLLLPPQLTRLSVVCTHQRMVLPAPWPLPSVTALPVCEGALLKLEIQRLWRPSCILHPAVCCIQSLLSMAGEEASG